MASMVFSTLALAEKETPPALDGVEVMEWRWDPIASRPKDRQNGAMDNARKNEILALAAEDDRLRKRLEQDGSFFAEYSEELEGIHLRNSEKLASYVAEFGFPRISREGAEVCAAACKLVLRSISRPGFQRDCLVLMREGLDQGEVPANYVALLEDRIRYFEGRPQLYGTNVDWDSAGRRVITPVEEGASLNQRRAFMGLPAISLKEPVAGPELGAVDPSRRQEEFFAWLRKTGWRR
jgi:hypothetical protein